MTRPPVPPRPDECGSVLLADDDAHLRRAYARILEQHGHTVTQVADGRAASEALASAHFDAIVSDISMPGIGGLDLLRLARDHDPDVMVILVTGFATVETAAAAVEHGALRYLVKPVDADVFAGEVRRAIALGRMGGIRRRAADLAGVEPWRRADRVTQEANLDRALDMLWIAWQPIMSVATHSVVAFEALVRTQEPALPNPVALLATADQLGRIHEVGRRVRSGVAEALATTLPAGIDAFVNLHPADLLDDDLYAPDAPLSAFASRVVLEVTERASLGVHQETTARVGRLRERGFRIAIDDLGAGYAGLSWFAVLAPEVVKLDISIVRHLDRDPVKRKLVRAMTTLSKDLSALVVAEGVESSSERDALVELGCDLLQGYHFARPGRPYPDATW